MEKLTEMRESVPPSHLAVQGIFYNVKWIPRVQSPIISSLGSFRRGASLIVIRQLI